jgi:hypothetical protein
MIKNYNNWLNESKEELLELAKDFSQNPTLKDLLTECEEGKNPSIRIVNTETAKSYIGVSISPDNLFSDLYMTTNPKIALIATIMKDANTEEIKKIRDIILDKNSGYLRYDVFAGENAMTAREIADKYNFQYRTTNGDSIPYYTATPVIKPFHVY